MLDGISGLPMVEEESLYADKSKEAMGRDEFLKMFLAQMRYQDPMNPMDTQQFSAQLAQFSSLEQLFNVNENLAAMNEAQTQSVQYQALSFIGKEVLAQGDRLSLEQGGGSLGSFDLEDQADCTIYVVNEKGELVKRIPLGVLEAGQQDFEWDGCNEGGEEMPSGTYGFDVKATGTGGEPVSAETLIRGQVRRVNLEGGTPLLFVGDIPLSLSQIVDIRVPAVAAIGE